MFPRTHAISFEISAMRVQNSQRVATGSLSVGRSAAVDGRGGIRNC